MYSYEGYMASEKKIFFLSFFFFFFQKFSLSVGMATNQNLWFGQNLYVRISAVTQK